MSVYTKVGSLLWMWPPFRGLERSPDDYVGRGAKLLWLALYTSPEAKQSVPGLFSGSINTMAEAMGSHPDEIRRYLDRLIEDDLVEFDIEHRVLRMIVLPDAGESPTNGNTIRGWWRKFQNVPACAVRDAHVPLLLWLMQEWSRVNVKAISSDHMKAWGETFGKISVPAARPRQRKHVQTTLFAPANPSSNPSQPSAESETLPRSRLDPLSNKNNHSETLPEPFGKEREKDPDRDQDQDLRVQREAVGIAHADPTQKPVLLLVPHPAFDADDLAVTLSKATAGGFPEALTKSARIALGRAIDAIGAESVHPHALAALGEYVASLNALRGGAGMAAVSLELVTSPGWLAAAIKRGMEWVTRGDTPGSESVH